jgi:hypothetical protein
MAPLTMVRVNFEEVQDLSLDLLSILHENGVEDGPALGALAMSFGRIFGPRQLSGEEELKWMDSLFQYASAYFAEGLVH